MKKYEVYNAETGEIYGTYCSDFVAFSNAFYFKKQHGDNVKRRMVEQTPEGSTDNNFSRK